MSTLRVLWVVGGSIALFALLVYLGLVVNEMLEGWYEEDVDEADEYLWWDYEPTSHVKLRERPYDWTREEATDPDDHA